MALPASRPDILDTSMPTDSTADTVNTTGQDDLADTSSNHEVSSADTSATQSDRYVIPQRRPGYPKSTLNPLARPQDHSPPDFRTHFMVLELGSYHLEQGRSHSGKLQATGTFRNCFYPVFYFFYYCILVITASVLTQSQWRGKGNIATVTLNGPSSRVIRGMLEVSFSTFNL